MHFCIMKRLILLVFIGLMGVGLLFSCTNLDERHLFEYVISGSGTIEDLYGEMGPGIQFNIDDHDLDEQDFLIHHEVYGTELEYHMECVQATSNSDVKIEVYIDEELIAVDSVFESTSGRPKLEVSGVFID